MERKIKFLFAIFLLLFLSCRKKNTNAVYFASGFKNVDAEIFCSNESIYKNTSLTTNDSTQRSDVIKFDIINSNESIIISLNKDTIQTNLSPNQFIKIWYINDSINWAIHPFKDSKTINICKVR